MVALSAKCQPLNWPRSHRRSPSVEFSGYWFTVMIYRLGFLFIIQGNLSLSLKLIESLCACSIPLVISDSLWPYGLPGSSVHGFLQARILEWVAVPSSRGPSWPRDQTRLFHVSCIAGGFFTAEPLWKAPLASTEHLMAIMCLMFF